MEIQKFEQKIISELKSVIESILKENPELAKEIEEKIRDGWDD